MNQTKIATFDKERISGMNTTVDNYLINGCERCQLGGTPGCKVHLFTNELIALRAIVLECGLVETCKWGVPCYTYQGKNVLLVSAFKAYCSISFLKGLLLSNADQLLEPPRSQGQVHRIIKFTDLKSIQEHEAAIKATIFEAIEVEKAGLKIDIERDREPIPTELEEKFNEDPFFKASFEALTPGRQRGYLLFFNAPKQSKTRVSRIEKSTDKILNGIGLHDHYQARKKK